MKRKVIVACWLVMLSLVFALSAQAQSAYISNSPYDKENTIGDLNGAGGVLVLSKRNDLVITVVNAKRARISAPERRKDGLYEYEVVVDRDDNTQPKIEVNRRGDVNKTDFTVLTKPDFFFAYLIEEVQKPIRMENQTAPNDAILDASLAQVEFQSTISDLKIVCDELERKGAKKETTRKRGDNSIIITTLTIPIRILEEGRQRLETAQQAHEALRKRLVDTPDGSKNATDKDWDKLDQLEAEENAAAEDWARLTHINVYAAGTNQLPVDVSQLRPRSKMVYGVLLLKVIEKVHASACAGFMEEGGRQYALREYDNARRAFNSALTANDTPGDLIPTIKTSIAHCDSCLKYERLTKSALLRITELKKKDAVVQTDIVKYYGAAADFMRIANKYNPCDYYEKNIKTLETYIENMPLAMKFTITKWYVDRVSAKEGGAFPYIELWAYYGDANPRLVDYSNDRKFRKLVSDRSYDYKHVGTSDAEGMVDMELSRKELPTGFFFRPASDKANAQIVYKDMTDIMSKSVGEYNKRQFRMKMYIRK